MATFDEYAKEAHEAINEIQSERNMRAVLIQSSQLLRDEWNQLTWCEQYLFKYQEHVNLLGNNLQCATTTTLTATPTFYLNLMATANVQPDSPLLAYIERYHAVKLHEYVKEQLDGQPECASRMLSARLSELSRTFRANPLRAEITNQLAKLNPFDIGGDDAEESKLNKQLVLATEIDGKSTELIGEFIQSNRAVCWLLSI